MHRNNMTKLLYKQRANVYLFSFKFFWCLFTHPSLSPLCCHSDYTMPACTVTTKEGALIVKITDRLSV